jgi:hypothetical protein
MHSFLDLRNVMRAPLEELAIFVAPALFVLLWASGFIGAKLGLQ